MVLGNDGSLFVWQLKTGHLDRICRGAEAEMLANICDHRFEYHYSKKAFRKIALLDCKSKSHTHSIHLTAHPVYIVNILDSLPSVFGIHFNIKRLVDEINNGENLSLSPLGGRRNVRKLSLSKENGVPPLSNAQVQFQHSIDFFKKVFKPEIAEKKVIQSTATSEKRGKVPEISLTLSILSIFHAWGYETDFDRYCLDFGMYNCHHSISFGTKGHGEYMSFPIPSKSNHMGEWRLSPFVSAQRQLSVFSLLKPLFGDKFDTERYSKYYFETIPNTIGEKYCPASLKLLLKYWNDNVLDVSKAAQIVFQHSFVTLPNAPKFNLINNTVSTCMQRLT